MSGTVPEEPVVDRNTGHLFEKRLVHKYVQVGIASNMLLIVVGSSAIARRAFVVAGDRKKPNHWRNTVDR